MDISEYERQTVEALKEVAKIAQLAYWKDRQHCGSDFQHCGSDFSFETCTPCHHYEVCRAKDELDQHLRILDIIGS